MKISLQRFAGATAILLLIGVCIWVSFNYLVWFLPAQPGTRDIALADLDGDGDLDAFLGGDTVGRIWLNDGDGKFKPTGQRLTYSRYHAAGLGDVDRNGTVDVIAARLDTATVWYNDGTGRMGN